MALVTTLTAQEAYDATNPDPKAYNLPPDHSEEDLQNAREQAANNLLLGSRANAAYWDSRQELEALRAQAEGHGGVIAPEDTGDGTKAEPVDGSAEDIPLAELAAPGDDKNQNADQSTEEKLRAQIREAGLTPEA